MPRKTDARSEILDAAERRIRLNGYNGFSFRDIAADIDVKSASIHYHFPTKGDLGAAVIDRYSEIFFRLVEEGGKAGNDWVGRYVARFRHALLKDRMVCLCGILGAEISGLPVAVADAARTFFLKGRLRLAENLVVGGLSPADADARALSLIAALQGGLIVARSLDDPAAFESIVRVALDGLN
ncbi:MAG: TetR/AcrR family transcriptional regulator [Proteobacteria bacterium]|nr:TetR/AcrR family transcriptional regulator [Pseudomonadota bacterium]